MECKENWPQPRIEATFISVIYPIDQGNTSLIPAFPLLNRRFVRALERVPGQSVLSETHAAAGVAQPEVP